MEYLYLDRYSEHASSPRADPIDYHSCYICIYYKRSSSFFDWGCGAERT